MMRPFPNNQNRAMIRRLTPLVLAALLALPAASQADGRYDYRRSHPPRQSSEQLSDSDFNAYNIVCHQAGQVVVNIPAAKNITLLREDDDVREIRYFPGSDILNEQKLLVPRSLACQLRRN